MKYLKVKWLHQDANEPMLLISELDDQRYEVRKVEVFADGRKGVASSAGSFGGTDLGELAVPSDEEIAQDCQSVIEPTTAAEFETVWRNATRSAG